MLLVSKGKPCETNEKMGTIGTHGGILDRLVLVIDSSSWERSITGVRTEGLSSSVTQRHQLSDTMVEICDLLAE